MRLVQLRIFRFGNITGLGAFALSATLGAGCYDSRSISEGDETDVSLQELIEDGPLPPTMQPGAPDATPPPRFCGNNGLPGGFGGLGGLAGLGGLGGLLGGVTGGGVIDSGSGAAIGGSDPTTLPPRGIVTPVPGPVVGTIAGTAGGIVGATGGTLIGGGGLFGGLDAGALIGGDASAPDGDDGGVRDAGASTGGLLGGLIGGTIAGIGGTGGGSGSCESAPIGFWRFDDCNTNRTDLSDSSNQGHSAFRNVDLTCLPGQEGQAVNLAKRGDMVYAPDQPDFVLDQGVTVATWVKPERIDAVATIVRKRDGNDSAFALVLNDRKYQFVIKLASDKVVSVSTPATAKSWAHIAATYDGTTLRLYKNGAEVAHKRAPGTLARGTGPLLMGNDIAERRLVGQMDNVWFNTLAAPAETIAGLTCLHRPPSLTLSPASSGPVAAGTTVQYTLSITNNNGSVCDPASFLLLSSLPIGFQSNATFVPVQNLASGDTASSPLDLTSGEETEPGSYTITTNVFGQDSSQGSNQASAEYVVAEPSGCHVTSGRELMIRDVSVVDDPVRTSLTGPANDPRVGAWTFGRLMQRLATTDAAAPDMTEAMLRTFLTPQNINSFSIEARPAMSPQVLDPWPRTSDGKLDLARAPLRLLAIVNRLDLKQLDQGKAGEGRLVYGVLDPNGFPMEFTVIFEYLLPARDESEFKAWADTVHALQALPFPSETYNAALQALTDRFTAGGVLADTPNGSALIDIRTNEIALSFQWQLREFHLSPDGSAMQPATLFQTPDSSFNFSEKLARFVNANESSILTELHDVPPTFEGAPFQTGSVFNNIDFWDAPGITNPEARHKLSLNTCNGCHGAETNTAFLQVNPRSAGQPSQLSAFLTGETVSDPVTGAPRRLAELARRRQLLESVVCAPPEP
jgi:Concanavalin A-like lectin/glucanases superfamily